MMLSELSLQFRQIGRMHVTHASNIPYSLLKNYAYTKYIFTMHNILVLGKVGSLEKYNMQTELCCVCQFYVSGIKSIHVEPQKCHFSGEFTLTTHSCVCTTPYTAWYTLVQFCTPLPAPFHCKNHTKAPLIRLRIKTKHAWCEFIFLSNVINVVIRLHQNHIVN